MTTKPQYILLLLLILTGFWMRLSFLLSNVYHVDEFISMLAVQMVVEKGWPILPSGLFYDHGLLFSLLSGALVKLAGFRESIARWPSLLLSVMTIAAYYNVTRRLFHSVTAGLLAAALFTFDDLSILWGGRVRMYASAHFFVLLSLFWLPHSTLQRPSLKGRYIFLAVLAGALLSHTVSFLILLPLALSLLLFSLFYRYDWFTPQQSSLWLQALVAILLLGGMLMLVASGQTSSTNALQSESAKTALISPGFLQGFFDLGLSRSRFEKLFNYYLDDTYGWLFAAILLTLPLVLYRLWRQQHGFGEIAFLFLGLFSLLVILEVGGLLSGNWRKTRYLFIILSPAFFMLSAASIAYLLGGIVKEIMWLLSRLNSKNEDSSWSGTHPKGGEASSPSPWRG
ncbi:glycosyltransferase family 39 protein, partial [Anaerolineales bacterium HSG25]|nr:glycosyltransferase family 39 protein [Anaerolineales bacterium HSG25]